MTKAHWAGLAVGVGLLLLLIVSQGGSRVVTHGAPGIAAGNADATQATSPGEPGEAGEPSAGDPATSALAFNAQLGAAGSPGAITGGHQQGPRTASGMVGSESGQGSGASSFGDVLFTSTATGSGGGFSSFRGSEGSGGGSGGPGGGSTPPGNGAGPLNQNGPFSNEPGDDGGGFLSDPPPAVGGNGPLGPFAGGGGPGGGPGNGGGPGHGGGPGNGGGPANGGGPGGDPARFFTGGEPGGSEGGPSITPPTQTSAGTVPAPPTLILLVVGGVGLLLGAKLQRPAKRS